jgi:hypothetical protein
MCGRQPRIHSAAQGFSLWGHSIVDVHRAAAGLNRWGGAAEGVPGGGLIGGCSGGSSGGASVEIVALIRQIREARALLRSRARVRACVCWNTCPHTHTHRCKMPRESVRRRGGAAAAAAWVARVRTPRHAEGAPAGSAPWGRVPSNALPSHRRRSVGRWDGRLTAARPGGCLSRICAAPARGAARTA